MASPSTVYYNTRFNRLRTSQAKTHNENMHSIRMQNLVHIG